MFLRYFLACCGWNRDVLLVSNTATYKLVDRYPIFDQYLQHEAVRMNDKLPVLVKCVPNQVPEQVQALENEIGRLTAMAGESWAPHIIEAFVNNGLNCLVTEPIESRLSLAQIPFDEAMRLGLHMLTITETLHKKFKLNHLHALASYWGYTKDGRRFVLANFGGLVSTKSFDKHGYHRVRALHQLGLTLRYLVDLDERFMNLNTIESKLPEFICSSTTIESKLPEFIRSSTVCGSEFTRMIKNLFAISADYGEVPDHLYTSMRASLLSMAPSDVLVGRRYTDLKPIGRGESASLLSALNDDGIEVVIKCSSEDLVDDKMVSEYRSLERLQGESWAPRVFELFDVPEIQLRCYVMEKLDMSLFEYRTQKGMMDHADLAQLGLKMTSIIETLHQTYGLRHGDLHPKNWMLRDASDLSSVVLIDFGRSCAGTDPLFLRDIREVPMTIRCLMDLNRKFYFAKKFQVDKIDIICPEGFCPGPLKEAIAYTLAMESFNREVYSYIKLNLQLIH
jgi:hypothetical protein